MQPQKHRHQVIAFAQCRQLVSGVVHVQSIGDIKVSHSGEIRSILVDIHMQLITADAPGIRNIPGSSSLPDHGFHSICKLPHLRHIGKSRPDDTYLDGIFRRSQLQFLGHDPGTADRLQLELFISGLGNLADAADQFGSEL